MRRLTQEEFIEKAKQVHGNKYDYSKSVYKNRRTKVCIICPEHGEFWQFPDNHVLNKNNCPYCAKKKKKTTDEFISDAKKIHGNRYDYSKVDYKNAYTKICIICPEHGEFWQTPHSHLGMKCGCKNCKKSLFESAVEKVLNEKNVKFIYQYYPEFLSENKSHLSLDFYLPDYNIAIECQGEQHFKAIDFAGKGKEWAENLYKSNIERDSKKKKICKENNLEIVYINFNDNVYEKINEILDGKL